METSELQVATPLIAFSWQVARNNKTEDGYQDPEI